MTKGIKLLFSAGLSCCLPALAATEMTDIAARLASVKCWTGKASYEVLLPSAADPVVYDIVMRSSIPAAADTLSPCDYVIDWTLHTASGTSQGFSAYGDGHHYRFRDTKLQEYHMEWDPLPFAPQGDVSLGVQRQAQFADILPQFLGHTFEAMATDTAHYHVTVAERKVDGTMRTVIEGVERVHGYDGRIFTYVLDRDTSLPVSIDIESNPGSISEQSVTVRYTESAASAEPCPDVTEASLMQRYPKAFGNYRHDNFHIENLPGHALPAFSARTSTAERYSRNKGDAFAAPTAIVFLDTDVATTPATVNAVREAVDALPLTAGVIWAFTGNDNDAAEEATGHTLRPGEHLLMSVKSLARDCGLTATPAIVICSVDGNVDSVITAFNNDLRSVVIQKIALAAE